MAAYRALVSFSGVKVSAKRGDIVQLTDKALIADLIRAGYIERMQTARKTKDVSE